MEELAMRPDPYAAKREAQKLDWWRQVMRLLQHQTTSTEDLMLMKFRSEKRTPGSAVKMIQQWRVHEVYLRSYPKVAGTIQAVRVR
jgi:hypothetical protein